MTVGLRGPVVASMTGVLVVWFVLSVLEQLRTILRTSPGPTLRVLDGCLQAVSPLLPRWTFFAPNPGTVDYHLCYRHRLANGEFTHWQEVSDPPDPARPAPEGATDVQFCLSVAMNGLAWPRQIQPALLSNVHRLGRRDARDDH
jgi:hypothetical protein